MKERFARWIALHLPKRLVYWCAIRVGAHATTGKYHNQIVPELTLMEALDRWDKDFRQIKTLKKYCRANAELR